MQFRKTNFLYHNRYVLLNCLNIENEVLFLWLLLKAMFSEENKRLNSTLRAGRSPLFKNNVTPKFLPLDEKEKGISQLLNIT